MPSPFATRQYTFPGQHVREYPKALANHQEDALLLAANAYTPLEVEDGSAEGDLTLITFHANAFTKEVYEPFFEALYRCLKSRYSLTVSSIWIADQAAQGDSATLNDERLGNDSHWFDHSRDVLQMVNIFRAHMKRPLVAVGHSMGGAQAVATATYHPRLFEALVLVDPAMTMTMAGTVGPMFQFALRRPETFSSEEEAAQYVRQHPFFKSWDRRALNRYIATSFHKSPTALYPDSSTKPKTSTFVEIRTAARPNPDFLTAKGPMTETERYQYPDIATESPLLGPVYNIQTRQAYRWLSTLRPPTLFVLGKGSRICPLEELDHRTSLTGTEFGGSGGIVAGNVKSVTLKGGHFLPMTNVDGTAEAAGDWLAERIRKWRSLESRFVKEWDEKTLAEKQRPEPRVEQMLRKWKGVPWRNPNALIDGGRSKL